MLEQMPISNQALSHPVRKFRMGTGEQAAHDTLDIMAQIINESIQNYYVRRWAEHITQQAPKDDKIAIVSEIFNYLLRNTKYRNDIYQLELIKTPIVSLQLLESGYTPALDCDDYVVLSLSLIKSLGIPVAIKAGAITNNQLEHVWGLVKLDAKWEPLDLCMPFGLGWEAPDLIRFVIKEVS